MCTCIHEEKEITMALRVQTSSLMRGYLCGGGYGYTSDYIYIYRESKQDIYMYIYTQSEEERRTYMKICRHRCGKRERTRAQKI
jgi:hypothetical protein